MTTPFADRSRKRLGRLRRTVLIAILAWSALIGASTSWTLQSVAHQVRELALREARIHFSKDLAFRRWATSHGGVYVPVDDRTIPNPYLAHLPDRDVPLPDGRVLTLVNPASMLRQLMDDYADSYGVRGRITSLKPLNPANAPDEWESRTLQRFAAGDTDEVAEIVDHDGQPHLRIMRPMITEPGCLKCHSIQGYQVGDIRGGIGVTVPLAGYRTVARQAMIAQATSQTVIWLVGVGGIGFGFWRGRSRLAAEAEDEAKLLHLSQQNQTILDSVGEGVIGIDDTCAITFFSPSASRILGWDADEIRGRKFHELVVPGSRVEGAPCPGIATQCRTLTHGQGRQSVGELLRRKNAPPLAVEVQSAPVLDAGRIRGAVLVFHDITERQESEKRSLALMEKLERSNRDLQDFAYVVSHDLQEPLRMVSSYLGLVRRRFDDKLDQDGREFIAFAVDGAQRMSRMITDLVEFSRVETRGGNFGPVELERVIGDCRANLSLAIADSGAAVTTAADLPPIAGDREQLVRLFQNLIGNAIKFRSPDRAPAIRIDARRRDDGRVEISVADNGIGIAPENHQRIFMIFQRVSGVTVDGTGIGLSVVKRIVERHGGTIAVRSALQEGATFVFDLPGETARS